jgi:hypothetical protein
MVSCNARSCFCYVASCRSIPSISTVG